MSKKRVPTNKTVTATSIECFPAKGGGKWHRRWRTSAGCMAYCGTVAKPIEIDTSVSPICYPGGTLISTMHPVVCKRCATAAATA